jgi:hypothetical protein
VIATIERGVAAAVAATVNCTLSDVALLTVIVPIVTPASGLKVVVPWTKCVLAPILVT